MSEFDLQPGERKLPCGCYAKDGRITGQAFLCDKRHRLFEEVSRPADDPATVRASIA